MKYYLLAPEVAGEIGDESQVDYTVHPPNVTTLVYQLSGWLGDDLLESFPCYIATVRLAAELCNSKLTGFQLEPTTVTTSDLFAELYPGRVVPPFKWLQITGGPQDDFSVSEQYELVVSEPALTLLQKFQLDHCDIEERES